MSMEEKLNQLISRNKIHEEIGIEDHGTKPTKISMITRIQRVHDRIDLVENHKIKDLENRIEELETFYDKKIETLEAQICELSTYNGVTQEMIRLLDNALRVIVATLAEEGIPIRVASPTPDLSSVSPEDLII